MENKQTKMKTGDALQGSKELIKVIEAILKPEIVGSKRPKTERKRPEFTFEELCFMLDMSPTQAGVMFACMLHNIHHYTQYVACKTILSKWKTKDYADKPLRKKLKLYVKWLQSELSKQGEWSV